MIFLLNLVFGLLAGWLTDYVLARMGVEAPVRVVVAVIVGIIIFLLNLAALAAQVVPR